MSLKSVFILVFVILHTVASATDYYVSSAGNDANDGLSPSTSWKTIAKVNSSFINLSPGDRILFNRGDTFYGTIIIGKSGSSGNPITLSAYGTGADPVISGFTTLSSWTNEGSNIYSKAVALASKSYLIVKVNGVNTAAGRYPNAGSWLSIDATSGSTQLTDAAIDASVTNWAGAEAVIRTDEFRMERVLISNHTSHTLTYAPTSEGALTGYGYFIQSDLRTLDQANEWFYDGTKFYIYGDPTSKKVEVSAYTNGVSINSFDYITFDHLSITGYGKNGFDIVDGSYISIKNCTIKFCGETGVYGYDETNGNSTGCIISDNVINQINGSGIYISSQFSNSYISGNIIKNIGMIVGSTHATGWELTMQGIILGNSSYRQLNNTNTIVEYNNLDSIAYCGISMYGTNITTRYNLVNHFGMKLNDGGGIYTYSLVPDPVYVQTISNNIVLNGVGNHDMTSHNLYNDVRGIYLDGYTKGVTVLNNTVTLCSGPNFFINGGRNCTIKNNTIYDARAGSPANLFINRFSNTVDLYASLDFENNLIICKDANESAIEYVSSYGAPSATSIFNNNYYARPINDNNIFYVVPLGTSTNLAGWQTYTGKEANSHKSPVAIPDTASIQLKYNASKSDKVIALAKPMIDITGAKYATSITLAPYTSAVLMVDPNPSIVVPIYVSSAIENATPSLLSITYNSALANIVPATSAFTVKVNSAVRTINSVSVSGTTVQLTLSTPIVYGDIITIDYTKPVTNPLQTPSGGQAVSIVGQAVTNRVASLSLPTYMSSSIENATPGLLTLVYNLTLANIMPSTSAFTVKVNSVVRLVNSVSISGINVSLTLEYPVAYGDIITVDYTKPSTNPLQTSAGGQAASFVAQTVSNRVGSVALPTYMSSSIGNATPGLLTLVYNLTLAPIIPSTSVFTVKVNAVVRAVNSVSVSGTNVSLTLEYPVAYGDIITVDYTKPSTNPLQSSAGGQAASFVGKSVTNGVGSPTVPTYMSSSIDKATPGLLVLVYNLNLANIVPATSAFNVKVNAVVRPLNSVHVSGTNVQLTLSYPVVYGDVITVDYLRPSTNPLQITSGGVAVSIYNQPVINNCTNTVPTVVLTSPIINSSFSAPANILITANASDPDGSVSLVEFYNGATKLGSVSSAPYSFTWNNVAPGNYYLSVTATDNFNAKTTSGSTYISVKNRNNKHPFVKILNPLKGNSYDSLSTIPMEAIASDSDGIVTKVEFFNGLEKLAELTSAPYTYTWKEVPSGKYSITAIATDNSNDTTASAPVEFEVGISINNNKNANSDLIKLYPNPNDGKFSIKFNSPLQYDRSEIIITDLAGKLVYNGFVAREEISKEFDLTNIKSGIYILILKDKGILVAKKFIKK